MPSLPLISGYHLRMGSGLDRAMLVKFMALTYREVYPGQDFAHLAQTVEQYFSRQTPLWWVGVSPSEENANFPVRKIEESSFPLAVPQPVGCLWMGNAIDQVRGDRHAHIFLLYIAPAHRRRGIASALVRHAEEWARARGDRQMGLQVFLDNQPALNLYRQMGYQTHSLWMLKSLQNDNS